MQPPFDATDGVVATSVGFAGGSVVDPSYEQVCAGGTGHLEAVYVVYESGRGHLRGPDRGLLAQHRPHADRRPVWRSRQPSPHRHLSGQ